ncbi:MAG: YciK family oxidoreductase [Gammaproteobacteria bacterium]|nr:YciK family oxidoreductase [Gammaproteobacteria bacterium]MCW8840471.1 YciK family oxidoreductase [Gammaproteobacteria bacterium]MCW8927204.1 YciK family oxidoreductase [Gammaproteobacteria bacterium]MCW8957729.1 YciK family oxidoreductase [Gammaproteobacteria bacterium]MCW8973939.1 YciK family oxidoreductase [Gammaproteobacteria bacterium]
MPVSKKDYQARPDLLKDRIILVTGAGSGIGAAAAKSFAAHGATVILLGRTTRKLETIYDEIEAAGHPTPAIYPMNLEGATPEDHIQLAETLEKEFGRLDGLLHNASILGNLTPLSQYNMEHWGKVMQVNLNAPYLMTRACLGVLNKSEDASVVFTSSSVGRKGRAYWGAYGISKAAVENMMQIWADELEANTPIRVNSINPGATRTSMRTRAYPGEDPASNPEPEAIMAAYLYLMGPDSKGSTGEQFDAQ